MLASKQVILIFSVCISSCSRDSNPELSQETSNEKLEIKRDTLLVEPFYQTDTTYVYDFSIFVNGCTLTVSQLTDDFYTYNRWVSIGGKVINVDSLFMKTYKKPIQKGFCFLDDDYKISNDIIKIPMIYRGCVGDLCNLVQVVNIKLRNCDIISATITEEELPIK